MSKHPPRTALSLNSRGLSRNALGASPKSSRETLKLLDQLGASLAGFPDVVILVKDALKKSRGGPPLAKIFVDGYNRGQRSLDFAWEGVYDDAEPSEPLRVADRKNLIRLASTLPVGSDERKAILSGLNKQGSVKSLEKELAKAVEEAGLGPKDQMGLKGRTMWLADGKGEVLIYDTTSRGAVLNYKGKEYKSVKDLMKTL